MANRLSAVPGAPYLGMPSNSSGTSQVHTTAGGFQRQSSCVKKVTSTTCTGWSGKRRCHETTAGSPPRLSSHQIISGCGCNPSLMTARDARRGIDTKPTPGAGNERVEAIDKNLPAIEIDPRTNMGDQLPILDTKFQIGKGMYRKAGRDAGSEHQMWLGWKRCSLYR